MSPLDIAMMKRPFVRPLPSYLSIATTFNTANSTTLVIDKPSGVSDSAPALLVAVMFSTSQAGDAETWTGDTSWNEVLDHANGGALRVAWKQSGAGEPSNYTFTGSVNSTKGGMILAFPNAAYDTIGSVVTASGGLPVTATGLTAASNNSFLIGFVVVRGEQVTSFACSGMTSRAQDNDAQGSSAAVFTEAINAGATGSRTFTGTSSNAARAVLLSVKPVP
jgi:hypothetical protein